MSEESIKITDYINVDGNKLSRKPGAPTTLDLRQQKKKKPGQLRVAGDGRTTYSDKQKMEAVCSFAVCGNSRRVAELTGVPEATIRSWKQTEWWYETTQRIVQEENEELDTKLTKLINKAVDNVNDRLDNGDMVYDTKRGKLVNRPMSGKDTAIVAAITLDKRQLLRGQPTSRVESVSQDERLLRLAEQFATFSKAKEVLQVQDNIDPNIIDVG
jgi:hypothetical protein